jgi:hypothetical protein
MTIFAKWLLKSEEWWEAGEKRCKKGQNPDVYGCQERLM